MQKREESESVPALLNLEIETTCTNSSLTLERCLSFISSVRTTVATYDYRHIAGQW
jgi:hypothetical protein